MADGLLAWLHACSAGLQAELSAVSFAADAAAAAAAT